MASAQHIDDQHVGRPVPHAIRCDAKRGHLVLEEYRLLQRAFAFELLVYKCNDRALLLHLAAKHEHEACKCPNIIRQVQRSRIADMEASAELLVGFHDSSELGTRMERVVLCEVCECKKALFGSAPSGAHL